MTLDDVRADAFRRFAEGAARPKSPFHHPALATLDRRGLACIRTVVLRGFDPGARVFTMHSDVRTPKIEEIRAEPQIMLHWWDAQDQVQIRVAARASLRLGESAKPDWTRLSPGSRATYAIPATPSTPIDGPSVAGEQHLSDSEAFLNFAVIEAVMDSLDWLLLAKGGNRRARLAWQGGDEGMTWLVP